MQKNILNKLKKCFKNTVNFSLIYFEWYPRFQQQLLYELAPIILVILKDIVQFSDKGPTDTIYLYHPRDKFLYSRLSDLITQGRSQLIL